MKGFYIHPYRMRLRDAPGNASSQRRVLEGFLVRSGDGFGCVHPWPELGDPSVEELLAMLQGGRMHRLLERALYCAMVDGAARRVGRSLFVEAVGAATPPGSGLVGEKTPGVVANAPNPGLIAATPAGSVGGTNRTNRTDGTNGALADIPRSHATVTGEADFSALAAAGFMAVKLKTHGGDAGVVERARAAVNAGLRVRVDCNGTGVAGLRGLREFAEQVEFVEDPEPYAPGRWREIREELGIPLALDRLEGPDEGGYDVRILKPALESCERRSVPVVFTSYMDHPLGQMFAAWEAARYEGEQREAGLLTHVLFEADAFTEAVRCEGAQLFPAEGTGLGFDRLLEGLEWRALESGGLRGRLLINPRTPLDDPPQEVPEGCLVFATSGSTGAPSLVCLTREAMNANAAAVNDWIHATQEDVWLRVLPEFHVGGMSIHFRAALTNSRVIVDEEKWDARKFVSAVTENNVTLTSLVPPQVFDLVTAGLRAPAGLRVVFIGGGKLEGSLYAQSRALGWPLLSSFGMTEGASQIATARLDTLLAPPGAEGPPLELLPCWEARVDSGDRLQLRGAPLLAGRMVMEHGEWRFHRAVDDDGWFTTSDRVRLEGRIVTPLGRCDRVVKVLGELVDLDVVEAAVLRAGLPPDRGVVLAVTDERAGVRPWLITDFENAETVVERANDALPPFARIAGWRRREMPRSPLGKILRAELENG